MECDDHKTFPSTLCQAAASYEFTQIMQSYKSIIAKNTTVILPAESDPLKFLKGMSRDGDAVPVQAFGARR